MNRETAVAQACSFCCSRASRLALTALLASVTIGCGDEPTAAARPAPEPEFTLVTPWALAGGTARLEWPAEQEVAPGVVFLGSDPTEVVIDSAGHGQFAIPADARGTVGLRVAMGQLQDTILELEVVGYAWDRKNEPALANMAFSRVVDGVASVVATTTDDVGDGILEMLLPDLTVRQLVPPQDTITRPDWWGPGTTSDPDRLVHSLTGVIWDVSGEPQPVDTIRVPYYARVVHQINDTLSVQFSKRDLWTQIINSTGTHTIYHHIFNEGSAVRISPDRRWAIPRGPGKWFTGVVALGSGRRAHELPILESGGAAFSADSRYAFVGGRVVEDQLRSDSVWAYDTYNWRRVAARSVPNVVDVIADHELPLLYVATWEEETGLGIAVLDQRTLEVVGSMQSSDTGSIEYLLYDPVLALDSEYIYIATGTDVLAFERPPTWPPQ